MKNVLLQVELLLLQLLPAVWMGLCYDGFKDLEPAGNKNSGAFLLLAGVWLFNRRDLKAALFARRSRAWGRAAAFCAVGFFSGMLLLVWFPLSWAWVPVCFATIVVMAGIAPAEDAKSTSVLSVPDAPPPAVPEKTVPAIREKSRDEIKRAGPGMRRLAIVLLIGVCGFGFVSFFLSGTHEPLVQQRVRAFFGSADAQLKLGWRYREGRGVPQDFTKAAVWFEQAAKAGSARAQYDFGILLYYELGTREIYGIPRDFFEQAARQNYAPAVTMLGLIALQSELDTQKAIGLWQRAASLGDPFAEYLLGSAYLDLSSGADDLPQDLVSGQSEKNLTLALFWLEKARRDGAEPIGGLLQHVWATVSDEALERVTGEVFRGLEMGTPP